MTRSRLTKTLMAVAVVGTVAAGAAVTSAVSAQQPESSTAPRQRMRGSGPDGGPGRVGPGGPGHIFARSPMGLFLPLRQLDLSEAQQEQVKGILQSHRDELQATAEKMRAAARAQHDAVTAVPFDEGAIRERAAALALVQSDAAVLHARVNSEVFAILTAEQQAKANELKAARAQQMSAVRQRVQERVKQRRAR